MFLFERIFGFGVYVLILLFVCFLLSNTNAPCKQTLKFYTICLCVMAFFYKPYITADLYRIYETMDYFAEMDFGYFWENFALGHNEPIARLLYWCIGRTGINRLLPVFSAFVCYSLLFYIINKTQELFSISKKNVAYVLFFIMTTSIYMSVIGGIRMMLQLSMIAFSFFRGTVEKKIGILEISLYVISIFLHSMSFAVIGICVMVTLFASGKGMFRKIGFAAGVLVIGLFIAKQFSDNVNALFQKILYYVSGDGYSDTWEYIMGSLIILLLLVFMYEFHRMDKDDNCIMVKSFNAATGWCIFIASCFCFEFSIFYRFGGQLAVIFSIPMMLVTLEKLSGKPSGILKKIDIKSILILFSSVIALISCTRGSLSSLKFFEL